MRRLVLVGVAAAGTRCRGRRRDDSRLPRLGQRRGRDDRTVRSRRYRSSRRDLVLRDDVDGTLSYATRRTLTVVRGGNVVTRLPDEGKVVTRGASSTR